MRASRQPIARISAVARRAASAGNWAAVGAAAREILNADRTNPEGWFLTGLAEKARGRQQKAIDAFSRALRYDAQRYDAAIELANQYCSILRHRQAKELLEQYEAHLSNSPLYLHMAAETWSRLGLHARAWPLYRKADELQPGIEKFRAGLAACATLLGKIPEAKSLYLELLQKHPRHQRNHYALSRLARALDSTHVEQMKEVLQTGGLAPDKNIFLYYAIAKELEDLEQWSEAFHYYRLGGDAAAGVARAAGYDVSSDIALIDKIIEVCDSQWLAGKTAVFASDPTECTPIFVVGLPRTGTTLTERIIASHSQVESADETFFLQIAIRRVSGVQSREDMSPRMIQAAAGEDMAKIAGSYLDAVAYRLGDKPWFVDKYPFNFLYLGFVARAFPNARIVHLKRNPMDACFAMYKQSFFKFAYALEDLARYYVAYDRLYRHWRKYLGRRIVEVEYESLVADSEGETRVLLDKLGLEFERACLDFHLNEAPSATASSVQIRERVHTRSVYRWKHFARELQPLRDRLEAAGIDID